MGTEDIVQGTVYFSGKRGNLIWKGAFKYYKEMDDMHLSFGERIYEDGYREKGEFGIFEKFGEKGKLAPFDRRKNKIKIAKKTLKVELHGVSQKPRYEMN